MGWKPMAVRAAGWALLGLFFAGAACAADGTAEPAGPPNSFPVATDARVGGDELQTRFVMDLDRKIDLHVFTLADPYRVVVDIPQVRFQMPPNTGDSGRGLIKTFRYGLVMAGGSRVVLDVTKPVRVDKAFVVDAADGAPARLVLDLAATDRDSFREKNRPGRKAGPRRSSSGERAAAEFRRPAALGRARPGSRRHRYRDQGAERRSGKGHRARCRASACATASKRSGKYRVLLTRDDDTFVPLADRVRIARNAGAALFVSIHADSLPRKEGDAQGATVYTLSETATDPEAARLAEEENRADVIAGVDLKSEPDDVAGILIDLAQRETKTFSVQFAHKLVGDMKEATRLHKDPLKSAGFRVLRAPDVPSVLVELGYVSNKQDLQSLLSDTWRDHTADCMARAIDGYFSTHVAGARAN